MSRFLLALGLPNAIDLQRRSFPSIRGEPDASIAVVADRTPA
jgi:hypothetical protein